MTTLRFVAKTWRATRVTLHFAEGLAMTVGVFPFIDVPRKRTLIRRWSTRLLALLDIRMRVSGAIEVDGGNVLIVCNHVSWLDIFVLNAQQPARFVAKAELARWPLVGRLIRGAGTIFIERERRRDTRRVNHHAAEALLRGDVVAVFPEGTTTDGTSLLRFHASLLQPIVESHGHVQPVALRYRDARGAHSTAPAYGDETFASCFWRVCGERGMAVDVIASSPIAAGEKHRRELAREAEDAIRKALAESVASRAPEKAASAAA